MPTRSIRVASGLALAACLAIGASARVFAQPKAAPAASASASTSAHAPATLKVPAFVIEKYTLGNGLEVILHEDHATPVVAVNVWYHVGSKDEAKGKNGFAHLFEHVMFQGSRNVGEDMFFKYLERAGVRDRNGTTNTDRTNYYETVPANELALALWLESDRMGFLLDHANEQTFKNQRDVVKNERRQNYENAPYGLVRMFVAENVYPESHPYHRLTIGTPADLDAATFEDVRQFFKTYYLPNNATLVVAGNFDKPAAKALIEKYFGSLPKGPPPSVVKDPIPSGLSAEKTLHVEAAVELPLISINWPTPPHFAPGDAELDLVAPVLATGKTSRLYKRLVYDLRVAQDVSAAQYSAQISSLFNVTITLKKDKALADVLKLVDEEIDKLRESPPTTDEIDRARARVVADLIFGEETLTSRANMLNEYNQVARDPAYFPKDVARYEAVTPEAARAAAKQYLPKDRRVVALVTPTEGAPIAGRLAEKPTDKSGAKQ